MPKPKKNEKKDMFTQGKYGYDAAYTQANMAFNEVNIMFGAFDDQLNKKSDEFVGFIGRNAMPAKFKAPSIDPNVAFSGSADKKLAEIYRNNINEIKKEINRIKNSNTFGLDKYSGYLKATEKILDIDSGDFGRAMVENSYLYNLFHQYQNGPSIGTRINLQDSIKYLEYINPVTKQRQKGPLEYLNNFFSIAADLLDREYEKQKILEDYSPEKEAEYLNKLNNDFKKMLANHEKLEAFVHEDGKSDYDYYLQNKLDTMARKDIEDTKSRRTAKADIENIRGQQKAIENGWGMNELDFPGKVSYLEWYIKLEIQIMEKKSAPEAYERSFNISKKRVDDFTLRLKNNKELLNRLNSELQTLKNNNADQNEIDAKTEEYKKALDDDKYLSTRLKDVKGDLDRVVNNHKANANKLKDMTKLYKQISQFNKELQNTKITCATDKIRLADKYQKIVDQNLDLETSVRTNFDMTTEYYNKAMQHGGKTILKPIEIPKDVLENTITDAEIDAYTDFFGQSGKFEGVMGCVEPIETVYPGLIHDLRNEFRDKTIDSFEERPNMAQLTKFKTGMKKYLGTSVEIRENINDEDRKLAKEYSKKVRLLMDDTVEGMKGYQKDFKRSYKSNNILNETEKGSVMRAMNDRDYLLNFYTQTSGNGAEVFTNRVSAENVARHFKELGALDGFSDFNYAGKDFFEVEFEKQRMQKSGWDAEKERLYLAKLEDVIDRSISGYEKFTDLPVYIQEEKHYMGNSFGHATGKDADATTRDIMPHIHGIKWMKEAIHLGYSESDLNILYSVGKLEGNIRRGRNKVNAYIEKEQALIDNAKQQLKNKNLSADEIKKLNDTIKSNQNSIEKRKKLIKAIDDFEIEKFNPLKESVLNRKIHSPADVIKTIVEIQEFHEQNKKTPLLSGSGDNIYSSGLDIFADTIPAYNDYYFPTVINNKLKELEDIEKNGKKPELDRNFKKSDKTREMSEFLNILKGADINDKDVIRTAAQTYIHDAFLNGMLMDAHPEYFDSKHPDYNISNTRLNRYTQQYADRLLEIMQPKSAAEFAYILENGNHKEFFSDLKDRIAADASKARMDAFISGKPPRFRNYKGIKEAREELINSPAKMGSSSTLYNDIVKNLGKLDKMKAEISRELLNQSRTSHKVFIKDYQKDINGNPDPTKPIYDMTLPEDVKLDPKKLNAYKKLQEDTFKKINTYLTNKDKIIRDNGGDPEKSADIALLGENGERRYKAMKQAKNSVVMLGKATAEFEQNGLSQSERNLVSKPGFKVDKAEYLNFNRKYTPEERKKAYDDFIKSERDRFQENLKYNLIEKNKQFKKDLNNDVLKQYSNRSKIKSDYLKIKNPTEAETKAYEEKIINSALQTVYSETIKNNFSDKDKQLFTNLVNKKMKEADEAYKTAEEKFIKADEEIRGNYDRDYNHLLEINEPIGRNPSDAEKKDLRTKYGEEKQKIIDELNNQKKIYEDAKKAYELNTKYIADGFYPANIMDEIQTKDIATINNGLQNGLSQYVNKNPKEFNEFKTQIMDHAPFKMEFSKRVLEESKTKNLNTRDILTIRDNILKESSIQNQRNPEELQRLDRISGLLGSNVKTENAIKQAKLAEREAAKNASKQANEMNKPKAPGMK